MRSRFFLYSIPAVLIFLVIVAFVNTVSFSSKKKNEMSLGLNAEPTTLNPLQASDAYSGAIIGMIFNGLLKENENLELVGSLASDYSLRQVTTFHFQTATLAVQAKNLLEAERLAHPDWLIKKITESNDPEQLLITLGEPGYQASESIASFLSRRLPQHAIVPFQTWVLRRDPKNSKIEIFKKLATAVTTASTAEKTNIQRYRLDNESEEWITPSSLQLQNFLEKQRAEFLVQEALQESHAFIAEPIIDFTLRRDVRWHDGAPFTSADVAFTCHAILDDQVVSPLRSYFELISKVEAPDEWHVSVHYRRPFSPALSSWTMAILPAHLLEKKPPATWATFFNRHPVGTGPFRFESWKSNEYVRLSRNTDYFLGSPWLDSIVFRTFPDPLTLQLAFETHQVDFWTAPPWTLKSITNNPAFQLLDGAGNSMSYIGWNLQSPLFADRSVREALAHAVNVPEMIHYILYGRGIPATGAVTPRMWFFDPTIIPYAYDPKQASQLLDQAGWKIGADGIRKRDGKRFSFTLLSASGSSTSSDIATLVQDDLKKIGIEVKIEVYEWTVFLQRLMTHRFDAVIGAWALSDDCDPFPLWHSSQSHPGEMNYTGYNNPHVDALTTELRQEYSRSKIMTVASELQRTLYHDQPYLFLFVPEQTTVAWKGSYRVCYPTKDGWVDTPLQMTKAGWDYNLPWFYRTDR